MSFSFEQIIPWLIQYRYFAVFPLAFIEGPIITIIVGFLSSLGYFNFFAAYVIIVAGDLTSDVLFFLTGKKGGVKFIAKWGRYIGVTEQQAESLEKYFINHGGKILFLGKLSHGIGTAFLVAAGLAKMPSSRFFFYNSLATLIKSLILLIIGYYFGHAFSAINTYLEKIAVLSIGAGVTVALAYFFYNRRKRKNSQTI